MLQIAFLFLLRKLHFFMEYHGKNTFSKNSPSKDIRNNPLFTPSMNTKQASISQNRLSKLLERIKQLQQENGIISEFIIADTKGRIIAPTISKAMYRRSIEAGIGAKSIHAIRRTVSSNLNKILPQATVALIMGHTEKVNEEHYNYDTFTREEKKRRNL